MSDSTHHPHHGIDYVEIAVTDVDAAKRFYRSAFDWRFNEYGPAYAGIQKEGGGEAGGLCLADSVRTGGPLVVLYSTDLDATIDRVRAARQLGSSAISLGSASSPMIAGPPSSILAR